MSCGAVGEAVELQSGLLIGRRAAKKLYMNSNAVQSYESTTVDDNGDNTSHTTQNKYNPPFTPCCHSLGWPVQNHEKP